MAIYGYCRVSTHSQRIERQETNIRERYPQAVIYKEAFTGTKLQGRKELDKILRRVNPGDTIVFDEVSRMSRNAEEGFALYKELFYKNINLVFLKEPHINTTTYRDSLNNGLALTGNDIADIYIDATNRVLMILAEKQIKYAFEQAQKRSRLPPYAHQGRNAEGKRGRAHCRQENRKQNRNPESHEC